MKILPTDAVERQSQWYAKGGISLHMSATVARINGELVSHEFSHVSSVSKQDSAAVAGILEHVFGVLKENGVSHIHLRTDNAATYHSVSLIAYLLHLADKLQLTILSHIFSEPQYGKGRADRAISLVKGKLNSYIDSGHSVCTPNEVITGFCHNILIKGASFYLIEVTPPSSKSNASLDGITKLSSFRFEKDGVRVRRHDAIGEGMFVKKEQLPPIAIKSTIHRKEGYLSQSQHFWKSLGTAKEESEDEVKESESVKEEESGPKEYLRCSDMLCMSRFKTERGLDKHVIVGKHKYYKATQTQTDYAVQAFSNLLETTEDAEMAVNSDSIVPIVYGDNSEERENGWALRKNETPKILLKVKTEVQRLVEVQLDGERRAEAKEIKEQLRELKNEDGSYKFHIDICLTESQIKSQIIRIVKDRKKKKSGGNDDEKQVQSPKRGRKRKEEQVAKKKEPKKGGRPSKKSREMVEEEEEDMEGDTDDDVMDEQREEGSEEQIEEELDIIGIMKEAVDERRNEIFDPDEFEEEL